jgi:hypothetical protein
MENWDQEAVDLVQPGFIEFDDDGLGGLGFIAVTGELDWREADRDGRPGVEFSWQGSDEGDDVSGRGWTALNRDGTLEGHIYFHLGDDSAFRAERLREGPGGRRTKHGASGPCWGGDADPFGSQVAASRGDGGHLGRRLIAVRALAGGLVSGTLRLPQGLNPLLAVEQPGGLGLLDRPASGYAQRDAGHHGLVGSLNQD